jgi:hypothetical protein
VTQRNSSIALLVIRHALSVHFHSKTYQTSSSQARTFPHMRPCTFLKHLFGKAGTPLLASDAKDVKPICSSNSIQNAQSPTAISTAIGSVLSTLHITIRFSAGLNRPAISHFLWMIDQVVGVALSLHIQGCICTSQYMQHQRS